MNKKKLIIIIVILIILGIGAYFGISYALNDSYTVSTTVNNKIKTGHLSGEVVVDTNPDLSKPIFPGNTLNKVVKVKNTGTIDAIVRVSVIKKWGSSLDSDNTLVQTEADKALATDNITINYNTTNWKQIGNYYYYTDILASDETTPVFLNSYKLDADTGNAYQGKYAEVVVNVELIQAGGNASETFWMVSYSDLGITAPDTNKNNVLNNAVIFVNPTDKFVVQNGEIDLFENFEQIAPGTSITQTMTIKNEYSSDKDIYLKADFDSSSIESNEMVKKLLSYATITIKEKGATTNLYSGPIWSETEDTIKKDINLGTFTKDQSKDFYVKITMPGELINNELSNLSTDIYWTFSTEITGDSFITINKKITDLDLKQSDATFIYKLTGTDLEGQSHTYYKALTFDSSNSSDMIKDATGKTLSVTFSGLLPGTYTATEEKVLKYSVGSITDISANATVSDKSVTFDLSNTLSGSATFVGVRTNDSVLTDNAIDSGNFLDSDSFYFDWEDCSVSGGVEVDSSKTCVTGVIITKYTGNKASVTVPSTLGGKNVTAIKEGVFTGHSEMTNLNLPDTLIYIGSTALDETGLTYLNVPANLEYVGRNDVANIVAIIPNECSGSTSQLYNIGQKMFGSFSFYQGGCSRDDSTCTEPYRYSHYAVYTDASCEGIRYDFTSTTNTTTNDTNETVTVNYATIKGYLNTHYKKVIKDLTISSTFTQGNGIEVSNYYVSKIAANAFNDTVLESVYIPNSVTEIGVEAFYNNPNLKTITINNCKSNVTLGTNWNTANYNGQEAEVIWIGTNCN